MITVLFNKMNIYKLSKILLKEHIDRTHIIDNNTYRLMRDILHKKLADINNQLMSDHLKELDQLLSYKWTDYNHILYHVYINYDSLSLYYLLIDFCSLKRLLMTIDINSDWTISYVN